MLEERKWTLGVFGAMLYAFGYNFFAPSLPSCSNEMVLSSGSDSTLDAYNAQLSADDEPLSAVVLTPASNARIHNSEKFCSYEGQFLFYVDGVGDKLEEGSVTLSLSFKDFGGWLWPIRYSRSAAWVYVEEVPLPFD